MAFLAPLIPVIASAVASTAAAKGIDALTSDSGQGPSGVPGGLQNATSPTALNEAYAQTQLGQSQQQAFIQALQAQGGLQNQSSVFQQQQDLAGQLQQLANGQGPNPAQAALAQATNANTANQAALMAGQRGAASNVGLIARQAAQQGAANQQDSIGQSATLQAQQQISAQQALMQQQQAMAALASQQVGNQAQALQGFNQNALAQQQNAIGAQNAFNNALVAQQGNLNNNETELTKQQRANNNALIGGGLKGLGGAVGTIMTPSAPASPNIGPVASGAAYSKSLGFAEGGMVPGEPLVDSNSPANDVVPAELSPGEIVLPLSVTQAPDPAAAAADFVQAELPESQIAPQGGLRGRLLQDVDREQQRAAAIETARIQEAEAKTTQENRYLEVPGMKEQKAGVDAQVAAAAQQGQMEAKAYETGITMQQRGMQKAEEHLKALTSEMQKVSADIKDGRINPNQYMENMSTGAKISTAIGMLLGGMGAGVVGGNNPVMEFLNKQIENDIEAQKANLGKQQNLLGALQTQFGNVSAAENMFQAIRRNSLADQIQLAAAKSRSPQAQAAAQLAIGKLKQEAIPFLMRAAALSEGSPSGGAVDPSAKVRFLVPEEHQKEVFHEIARAQNAVHAEKDIMAAFDKAAQENTVLGRAGRLGSEPPSIGALKNFATPLIRDASGTVNETELHNFDTFLPRPGDLPDTTAQKRENLSQWLHHYKAAPTAKGFGIDLTKHDSTRQQDNISINGKAIPQEWVNWMNKNQHDPMAQRLMMRTKGK